jgi:hypothetical protein
MKIADLKEGDRLEDYRRGVVFVIKQIAPCGSCPCGWGEIFYEEVGTIGLVHLARKRCKTFKQFELLRFLRRVDDRGQPWSLGEKRR